MGLAWFDDDAAEPRDGGAGLRTGGLPRMPPGLDWPRCPRCEVPMLFRAQVPLALTSLTGFDDERLLLVFECHVIAEGGPCDWGEALVVGGELAQREAPESPRRDVVLMELGTREAEVMRIVRAVSEHHGHRPPFLPRRILQGAPRSIARETVRAIGEAGGRAASHPSAPTTLGEVHAGRLVPFDDGPGATFRTTLPPLHELPREMGSKVMRGLVGASGPGEAEGPRRCACAKPMRTAVRLVAVHGLIPGGTRLGMSVVQVCVRCSRAAVHRAPAGPAVVRLAC